MFISFHPSQFFLLTSQKAEVINTSVKNFNIFAKILALMKLKNKPILLTHVGAIKCYANMEEACDSFC
jgi:UV DNA damage repair endonuclease